MSLGKSYTQKVKKEQDTSVIQSLKRKIQTLETENKELKLKIKHIYGQVFENTD